MSHLSPLRRAEREFGSQPFCLHTWWSVDSMCYYIILVLCQREKKTFSSQPNCAGSGERATDQHTTLCPLKTTNTANLHINTLTLVRVKAGRAVSARGWSQRGCSGLAMQGAAARRLWHCPSLHVQVFSAQLPAAGKQVIPFLQAQMLLPAWPSCHGCL